MKNLGAGEEGIDVAVNGNLPSRVHTTSANKSITASVKNVNGYPMLRHHPMSDYGDRRRRNRKKDKDSQLSDMSHSAPGWRGEMSTVHTGVKDEDSVLKYLNGNYYYSPDPLDVVRRPRKHWNQKHYNGSLTLTSFFPQNGHKVSSDATAVTRHDVDKNSNIVCENSKINVFSGNIKFPGYSRNSNNNNNIDTCNSREFEINNNHLPPLSNSLSKTSHSGKTNGAFYLSLPSVHKNIVQKSGVTVGSCTDVKPLKKVTFSAPKRKSWGPPVLDYKWNFPEERVVMDLHVAGDGKLPSKPKGSRTPRKSKRMAANFDYHSSDEFKASRSVKDCSEQRPPLPSRKSEEKSLTPKSADVKPVPPEDKPKSQPTNAKPLPTASKTNEAPKELENSLQESLSSEFQDDTSMIQQLKQMNHKDQKRKKDIPKWLKSEDVTDTPFEAPRQSVTKPEPIKDTNIADAVEVELSKMPRNREDHMIQSHQEDVDMLIDEEMAMWPTLMGKNFGLKSTLDNKKSDAKGEDKKEPTPVQKIQQKRAKWRENQKKNLEESWGSLNKFDRNQRGRISMDLDDDALDEYLKPLMKPEQPTIAEEEAAERKAIEETDKMIEEELNTVSNKEDDFVIPELPSGKEIVINIRTTWGDKHYVGLTGIDLFSSTGEAINVTKITAKPLDINVLDEYNKDPRVVSNLIDGVNRTRDDVHMWLTPFNATGDHFVYLTLDKPHKLAMMRIWNYNKSRIHSYRGAKDVEITLDNNLIFKGEIARACGGIEGGTEAFGDTILFTTDEQILELVSQNDDAYEGDWLSDDEPDDVPFERPSTADEGDDTRPFTRAQGNLKQKAEKEAASADRPATSITMPAAEGEIVVYKGRCLELNFTETWGDHHYIGLTGLEIIGKDGDALSVNMSMLSATPQDLHSLPGHERDDRTLDKVIDGTNITMSDEHMWLVPFTPGNSHLLKIDFGQPVLVSALRIWNYNKTPEDTFRGARVVHVKFDNRQISPSSGYLIRKGPGVCHFDFAQEIILAPHAGPPAQTNFSGDAVSKSTTDEASMEYEAVQMPCGFIYQFQLLSTWGDPYYVGLNGIEFFDAEFNKIQLTDNNISAHPESVNILPNNGHDVRTPDKLIDGFYDSSDGSHLWLAPILPNVLNRVYVIFDEPTTISMIKLWNYSKTPTRGAKEFALLVDDLLVYNGILQAVSPAARGILPTCDGPQKYHTIIFTANKAILKKEKHTMINLPQGTEQDIQLTNDKTIVGHYSDPSKAKTKPVNQELRPKTSVTGLVKKRR